MRSFLRSITTVLVAAVTLVAAAPASALFTFAKVPMQPYSVSPSGVGATRAFFSAVGDVNNDGHQDIVLASDDGNVTGVQVALGRGDGTFTAVAGSGTVSASAGTATSIAIGDMDGDGKLDVAYTAGNGVYVAWGNGDGTFQPAQGIPISGDPAPGFGRLAAADVNGDGTADLLAPDVYSAHLYVWELHRDRSVSPPGVYPLALPNGALTAADVNGDGHPDAIVASDPTELVGGRGSVAVLLNHGDGTFGAPVVTPAGHEPLGVHIGDVNGDGHPDVVTANFGTASQADEFWILLGHGDGTFTALRHRLHTNAASTVPNPSDAALGDFDGDGKLDLMLISDNGFTTWHGDGRGAFTIDQEGGIFGNPFNGGMELTTGDFNGDGHPDVATGSGLFALDVLPTRLTVTQVTFHRTGPHRLPVVSSLVAVPQAGTLTIVARTTLPKGRHARKVLSATDAGRSANVLTIGLNIPARYAHHIGGIRLTYTFRPKGGGAAQILVARFGPK